MRRPFDEGAAPLFCCEHRTVAWVAESAAGWPCGRRARAELSQIQDSDGSFDLAIVARVGISRHDRAPTGAVRRGIHVRPLSYRRLFIRGICCADAPYYEFLSQGVRGRVLPPEPLPNGYGEPVLAPFERSLYLSLRTVLRIREFRLIRPL